MRKQRIFLENGVDIPFFRRKICDVPAFKQYFSAVRFFKSAYDTQRRGFSAAGRAEQRNKFVSVNLQIKFFQYFPAVKRFADSVEL